MVRFWNPDRTVQSDQVNREPFIKTVLLAFKTDICKKKNSKLHKPQLNLPVLKTVDGFQRFNFKSIFFFFWYLLPLLKFLNHSEMLLDLELASPFLFLLFLLSLSFFFYFFLFFFFFSAFLPILHFYSF